MNRIHLAFAAALLLAACNRVETDHPLFGEADAAGAPVLRDGVWLLENKASFDLMIDRESDSECRVDTRRAPSRWPDCAVWLVVEGGQMRVPRQNEKKRLGWDRQLLAVAGGEPPILQVGDVDEDGEQAFTYYGFKPTASVDGRVTAFDAWTVDCGPPPPQGDGQPTRYLTWELSPGLVAKGDNCTTDSRDALRTAARASTAWQTPGRLTWVTDRYR